MPTVIDALVMTFGLDGSSFAADSSKAKKEMKGLSDEAKKRAEETEANLKKMGRGFEEVKKMAGGLFVMLAGATGLTDFISQVVQAEAALGRLSVHTGQSTQDLQAWGNIAALAGGKAEEMQAGMAGLAKQMVDLKYKGDMSPTLIFFNQMGVALADSNGQMKSQNDLMLEMADRAKGMKKDEFYNLASSAGLNDSQIDTILKGRTELEKMLKAQEANALTTKEQAEQARQLMAQWAELKQGAAAMGRQILSDIIPMLELMFSSFTAIMQFLKQHRGFIYGFFIVLAAVMAPVVASTTLLLAQFLLLSAPILAVAAAIGFLIDDFLTWKDGGDSLIPWDKWSTELDLAIEGIQKLIQNLGKLGGAVDAIKKGDFAGAWNIIQSTVSDTFKDDKPTPKPAQPANSPPAPATASWSDQLMAKGGELVNGIKQSLGMSGGKSGGGKYKFSFGNDVDSYISQASKKYGIPEDVLRGFVKMEAGWKGKMSPTGAIGTGQFIQPTWDSLSATSEGREIGMTKIGKRFRTKNDPRHDKRVNTLATGLLAKKNADLLRQNGLPVTGENLYMLHNIGPGVINAIKGSADVSKATLKAMRQNGMKKGMSASDFVKYQKNNFNKHYGVANAEAVSSGQGATAGAKGQATLGGNVTSQNANSHVETSIGEVNIYTAATDAQGIAGSIGSALEGKLAFNTHSVDTGMS